MKITLNIGEESYNVDIKPYDSLNKVLRVYLGLTGTKRACDYGGCGSCTVLLDGEPVYSCMVPAIRCVGKRITTVEANETDNVLKTIQEAFARQGAVQCGFCTPGMTLVAKALIAGKHNPSTDDIKYAIAGNICRCTGYVKIVEAIEMVAESIGNKRKSS